MCSSTTTTRAKRTQSKGAMLYHEVEMYRRQDKKANWLIADARYITKDWLMG